MPDDYLWDRSGAPESEVERLEELLGRYRYRGPAVLELPARVSLFGGWLRPLAAVAAIVLLVAAGFWWLRSANGTGWEVESLAGAPRVGSEALEGKGRLPVGEWLETDAASRARIAVGLIGEVEVEPRSRLRLVRAQARDHRLALAHGRMRARIWAPPRLFFVETPAALAVDLGCVYTLEVDSTGAGLLRVESGWVQLESASRESVVPAGAVAAMSPGSGPGAPYYPDASEAFKTSLMILDFGEPQERAAALSTLLAEARREDAITLLTLLARVEAQELGPLHDRLAVLLPPPAGVTREGILRRDQKMIDLWWTRLGIAPPKKWKFWRAVARIALP
jgi:hypothetical protein